MGSTASIYHINNNNTHQYYNEYNEYNTQQQQQTSLILNNKNKNTLDSSHFIHFSNSPHNSNPTHNSNSTHSSHTSHPSQTLNNPTDHIVNEFLNKQVKQISLKVIEQRKSKSVPKIDNSNTTPPLENLRQAVSSTNLMFKTSSVRAHAFKQHSRQRNTYISASSLKFSIGNGLNRDRSCDTNDRSGNSIVINSSDANSADPVTKQHNSNNNNNNNTNNVATNNNNQDNPIKKKFNLKLQINDEEDWIQVYYFY